jgi:hypothetical protein
MFSGYGARVVVFDDDGAPPEFPIQVITIRPRPGEHPPPLMTYIDRDTPSDVEYWEPSPGVRITRHDGYRLEGPSTSIHTAYPSGGNFDVGDSSDMPQRDRRSARTRPAGATAGFVLPRRHPLHRRRVPAGMDGKASRLAPARHSAKMMHGPRGKSARRQRPASRLLGTTRSRTRGRPGHARSRTRLRAHRNPSWNNVVRLAEGLGASASELAVVGAEVDASH